MSEALEKMNTIKFHEGCEDTNCKLCFYNNDILADALEVETDRYDLDLLGLYHLWLGKNDINPETEHGWWAKDAFNIDNVKEFSKTVYVEE